MGPRVRQPLASCLLVPRDSVMCVTALKPGSESRDDNSVMLNLKLTLG